MYVYSATKVSALFSLDRAPPSSNFEKMMSAVRPAVQQIDLKD